MSWPRIPVHWTARELLGEVSVSTIHERLRDEHGLTTSLASLRRYGKGEAALGVFHNGTPDRGMAPQVAVSEHRR